MVSISGGTFAGHMPSIGGGGGRSHGPTISSPSAKSGIGHPKGIAGLAHSVGKPGNTENLGNLHTAGYRAPKAAIPGGDPMMHSMNHYGKPSASPAGGGLAGGVDPTAHAGANVVRGAGMREHIRQGALGPGMLGAAGPNFTNYSGMSFDQE